LNLRRIFDFSIFTFKKEEKKKAWIALSLVFLLAIFLRLYKLGQQSLIADEFLGMNISYGYFQTGEWKFWDFNKERLTEEFYTRAKVYYWQVAQIWNWLSLGEGHARLVSVVWGLGGILLIYGVVYYFSRNWRWAILAAFFLTVSPSALTFDRKLRMYSMFAPIFFAFSLSLFFLLETQAQRIPAWLRKIQTKTGLNWLWWPVVFVLGFLSLSTHLLTVNIFPIVLTYLLISAIRKYFLEKKIFNRYVGYLLVMLGVLILAIQNKEIYDSLNFFSWVSNWSYFEKVIFDYSHPLLAISFLALGMYYIIKNFSQWGLWIATNFLVILFLAAFVWKRNAGLQYLYFITPFRIIIFSGGVYFLVDFLSRKVFPDHKRAFWGAIFFSWLLLPNWGFFLSPEGFYQNIKNWKNPNYREVYGYYIKNRATDAAIISRPLASYYLNGSHSAVLEYSGDNPLTLDKILEAQNNHSEIWAIFSKDTYIKKEAEKYIQENFQLIKTLYTNDTLYLYVWRR